MVELDQVHDVDFDSLWNPVDFVYNPVTFNMDEPIVTSCYELMIPESIHRQGIQYIFLMFPSQNIFSQSQEDFNVPDAVVRISSPNYFYQNSAVKVVPILGLSSTTFDIDYRIENFIKVGNEACDPDPSYNRDECVIKQLQEVCAM